MSKLCKCDGSWHVTDIQDSNGTSFSVDIDDELTALLDKEIQKAVTEYSEWLGGNDLSDPDEFFKQVRGKK